MPLLPGLALGTALGWIVLSWLPQRIDFPSTCGGASLMLFLKVTQQAGADVRWPALLGWSASMVMAMMAPGLYRPMRHIELHSLRRRTPGLLGCFWAAYVLSWLAPIALLLVLGGWLTTLWPGPYGAPALGLGLWYAWACTPIHQMALNRCHVMPPLNSFGGRAAWDAWMLGWRFGGWCIVSCWPLMLLPMLSARAGLPVMVGCAVAVTLARLSPPRVPTWHAAGFLGVWATCKVSLQWTVWRLPVLLGHLRRR